MNGFVLGLGLKRRLKATRKWPIIHRTGSKYSPLTFSDDDVNNYFSIHHTS